MSDYVRVYKTRSSEMCSGLVKTTKTCKACFLASASVSLQALAVRSVSGREDSELDKCLDSHVLLATGLTGLGMGKSYGIVKAEAGSAIASIMSGSYGSSFGRMAERLLSKDSGYMRITFGDDLRGTEIYSDGASLSEYILSDEGRYLFDMSIVSNGLTNVVDACRPPASRRKSFRAAAGGAWILSNFGEFSRLTDESGNRSFSVYIDGSSLSAVLCCGAGPEPASGMVVVGDMRSADAGQDSSPCGGNVVQYLIDGENAPMCADLIRKRHPGSVVVLGQGICPEPFQGLPCVTVDGPGDLQEILRRGLSYRKAAAMRNLIWLRGQYGFDRLDSIVVPKMERILSGEPA